MLDRRTRLLLSAAALIVIISGLRAAAGVLDPLLMAAVVVACAVPLQESLRARGLPQWLALTLTALTVVGSTLAFGGLIGYAGTALVKTVPQYQDRLSALLASGMSWLDARGIDASTSKIAELISPARLIGLSTSLLASIAGALSVTLLIVLLAIFLLVESNTFMTRGGEVGEKDFSPETQATLTAMARDVQQYLWITFITGVIYALGVWILLIVLGVDLAFLWAIFALVLSFVPGVGFVLSMVPPLALAMLEFGPVRALILAGVLVVFNSVVDNVIKPRFMKQGFDMGPFVMFTAILFWSYVLGPTGALLAIPLTVAVKRVASLGEPKRVIDSPASA